MAAAATDFILVDTFITTVGEMENLKQKQERVVRLNTSLSKGRADSVQGFVRNMKVWKTLIGLKMQLKKQKGIK